MPTKSASPPFLHRYVKCQQSRLHRHSSIGSLVEGDQVQMKMLFRESPVLPLPLIWSLTLPTGMTLLAEKSKPLTYFWKYRQVLINRELIEQLEFLAWYPWERDLCSSSQSPSLGAIFCHVLRRSASKTAPRLVTLVQLICPFICLSSTTARLPQEVFARTLISCRPITLFLFLFILGRFHCRSSSTTSRLPCSGSA